MGIYLVMKNNFKRGIRHKSLFTISFLLPVMICIIAGSINFGKSSIRVGILGIGNLPVAAGKDLYQILDHSEGIRYAEAYKDTVNLDLMTAKFNMVLDYSNSRTIGGFQLLSFQEEDKIAMIGRSFKESFLRNIPVDLKGLKPAGLSVTERSIALLLSLFMILSTVHSSMLIRDKQNGTLLRYRIAKQNSSGYVAGCFIQSFLITYVQVLFSITALIMVQKGFSLNITESLLIAGVIAVMAAVFSTSVCLASKSELQANITASALASLMSLLGGTFIAVEAMPGLLKLFSYGSPVRWAVELAKMVI